MKIDCGVVALILLVITCWSRDAEGKDRVVAKLHTTKLKLVDGKFKLDGPPVTHADKERLAELYLSLHAELYHYKVLPRKGFFSYTIKKKGKVLKKVESVARLSVGKFMKKKVKPIIPANSRCLEWGKGYIRKFPGCASLWSFEYEVVNPRLDKFGRTVWGSIDEPFPPDLDVVKNFFHVIVCTQVFEHLRHPAVAAQNLFAMLKEGGLLVWSAPFMEPEHKVPEDHYRYTVQGAEHLMHDAGFVTNMSFIGGNAMLTTARLAGFTREDLRKMPVGDLLVDSNTYYSKHADMKHHQLYWGTYFVFQKVTKSVRQKGSD